jgi:hypothetical protein
LRIKKEARTEKREIGNKACPEYRGDKRQELRTKKEGEETFEVFFNLEGLEGKE